MGRLNLKEFELDIIEPIASSEVYRAAIDVQQGGFTSTDSSSSSSSTSVEAKIDCVESDTTAPIPVSTEVEVEVETGQTGWGGRAGRDKTHRRLKYQSSGRQPNDLIKSRASLRNGYSRYDLVIGMC